MRQTSLHPLDRATLLSQNSDGSLTGRTDPAYAHAVGPFGGITAATLLNAALSHSACLGDPLALTVNYARPIADGEFRVESLPVFVLAMATRSPDRSRSAHRRIVRSAVPGWRAGPVSPAIC